MTMGRAVGGSAEKARRVADAQGVDDADGHALAGFIEAEASFGIRSNNGGRSWVCGMTLTQRDDDADMLLDIVRVTGLGRLHRRPAQRSSRPQVCWSVQSKLECRHLVRLLERYPLRGRKQREFAVWAAAVNEWADSLYGTGDAASHRVLRAHATDLRVLRRYVDRPEGGCVSERRADGLTAFLGGFFTGEGSFSLDGRAVACIHLRADDADLLRTFHKRFELGRINLSTPTGLNPSVKWTVGRRAELSRAIALLDAALLRGRKRREFEAWRIGAAEYARGRDRDEAVIEAARAALHEARSYVEGDVVLPSQVSSETAYLAVLGVFPAEEPVGKLTATAYVRARERHPEWPNRNTIASAFGGWARALEAAGLGSRVTGRARSGARRP
jgi:hypothetical protein